ncbi:MAG: Gfo/Idh/MocA family oxidoreductase [Acidobacteria bacterium]|nr:Gfo/Idh/MocA family oxidoreductase [Acidobacteriota bacterium]
MEATRRTFIQAAGLAGLAAPGAAGQAPVAASDRIRIGLIGAGGMGQGDARYATSLPGVELVAVADCYNGRLEHCKETWGAQVATTRDYREILARKDIDAVIVATPDHWHSTITIEAMNAGKDVYCEKPMVQKVEDGPGVVAAQQRTGRVLQIGSQYVSSLVFQKARQLFEEGSIGELNMVEAWLDRNTALGAWQYSIPPDANEQTVDWQRFQGRAPHRAFDARRVFRWRNYQDYGTGVAGDLFVHLLSGLHLVTGSHGPARIFATGGLRFWNDGRDVPDVMLALLDYPKSKSHPEFTLVLKVNLEAGSSQESFGFRFIGNEGVMTTSMSELTLGKAVRRKEPGHSIETFSKATQEEFLKEYRQQYPEQRPAAGTMLPEKQYRYVPGDNAHLEHHRSFYDSVRTRKPSIEDAVYGYRAAGPALLCNASFSEHRPCGWDPEGMKRTA